MAISSLVQKNQPLQNSKVILDQPTDLDTLLLASETNDIPKVASDQLDVEAFWTSEIIQLKRWNGLYPYQFIVVKALTDETGKTTHQLEPGWQFTLPIPPEAMTITMPFAIQVLATQGGIIEEHNGAPFRQITLRGSTGVLPARDAAQQQTGFSFPEAVFAGTVSQFTRLQGDFGSTRSSGLNEVLNNPNIHPNSDFNHEATEPTAPLVAKTTGYYQFRKLQQFFEAYASYKKIEKGRDLRLAFCIWKDQSVYLVTPQSFEVTKGGNSPFEYAYNIVLRAWRRVTLAKSTFEAALATPVRRNPNRLASMMNTLGDARRVLQDAGKVVAAAIGDVDRLISEPLREATMAIKDVMGIGMTFADLPSALTKQLKLPLAEFHGDVKSIVATGSERNDKVRNQRKQAQNAANEIKDMVSANIAKIKLQVLEAHPAFKPLQKPQDNYNLMSRIQVGAVNLPPAIRQQIAREQARVRSLRRKDFEIRRDQVRKAADALAIALGAGNATYEATYGVVVPRIKETPTQSDWAALNALNSSAMALDSLAATGDNEPTAREDLVDVMAGLARRSGIAFKIPRSKFAVPFPYGITLEKLAQMYLDDPDRWQEIAVLNGLREPYVDEVGFDLPLVVNGAENQIVVSDATNLYIGQFCYIWSNAARRTRRRIVALRQVGPTTVVTVNGDSDMGSYRLVDSARLSTFLPDTVNSQSLIYIPSDREPASRDFVTKSIPGVDEFDPMVASGGVDLLLDLNNDLVITPDGDGRFAVGLTNIIQGARIALSVQRGTLPRHPGFGLPLQVGMSTADFDAGEVLNAVRRMFADDPSIATVDAVQVSKNGPIASIKASITAHGTDQPIPISFDVARDF